MKMKNFHKTVGCFFGLIFFLIFTGKTDWFNGFQHAQDIVMDSDSWVPIKSRNGFVTIYILAFSSVFLLVCPAAITRIWHSDIERSADPFLKEGVWIFLGYFLLLVTFGILFCFE
jgi:hypothetical protein